MTPADVLAGLEDIGFDDFVPRIKLELEAYELIQQDRKLKEKEARQRYRDKMNAAKRSQAELNEDEVMHEEGEKMKVMRGDGQEDVTEALDRSMMDMAPHEDELTDVIHDGYHHHEEHGEIKEDGEGSEEEGEDPDILAMNQNALIDDDDVDDEEIDDDDLPRLNHDTDHLQHEQDDFMME